MESREPGLGPAERALAFQGKRARCRDPLWRVAWGKVGRKPGRLCGGARAADVLCPQL